VAAAQFHASSATSRKKAEVAERRRRGTNPADDRPDVDEIDDELIEELDSDDEDEDDVDDEFDDELDDDDDDEDSSAASNGGRRTATKTRRKSSPPDKKSTKTKEPRRGILFRLINFIREVVAELRKVIWPTRKELITYTAVVVVFVSIMLTVVGLLDYGFAKVVLWVFGDKTTPAGGQ
jgi:preprotein translocase subunit SecE